MMTSLLTNNLWLLKCGGDKNLGLVPDNLEYFQNHFVKKPMSNIWSAPAFKIDGRSKKLRDFVSWMNAAPVVSEAAMLCIESICGENVEFLPMKDIKGKNYYAINVITVEDVLDLEKCDLNIYDKTGDIISVRSFAFKDYSKVHLPSIFKVPQTDGAIFVTKEFADIIVNKKLTGLMLADPGVDNFQKILKGEPLNVYPGIIE